MNRYSMGTFSSNEVSTIHSVNNYILTQPPLPFFIHLHSLLLLLLLNGGHFLNARHVPSLR